MKTSQIRQGIRLIVIFIFVAGAFCQSLTAGSSLDGAAALTLAKRYAGVQARDSLDEKTRYELTLLRTLDDRTPIMRKWINGKNAWQVDCRDVDLREIYPFMSADVPSKFIFHIIIDAESGFLLKIWSKFRDTSYVGPESSIVERREQELALNGIDTTNLPVIKPVPFLTAVRNCPFNITQAVEIEAFYVLRKMSDEPMPRPVWLINLYGYPYLPHPPPIAGKAKDDIGPIMTNFEVTLDGLTGKPLFASGGGR